jgi:hypothetical protein
VKTTARDRYVYDANASDNSNHSKLGIRGEHEHTRRLADLLVSNIQLQWSRPVTTISSTALNLCRSHHLNFNSCTVEFLTCGFVTADDN